MFKAKKRFSAILAIAIFLIAALSGCSVDTNTDAQKNPSGPVFNVLSSSENKSLEYLLTDFGKQNGVTVNPVYKGSVDIMRDLQNNAQNYDAVWVSNSIWLSLGDSQHKVKDAKSVMTSPVVIGVRKSLAQQLGFVGKQVKMDDILSAVQQNKLKFMMTSATQSNSGTTFYLGALYSFLGQPQSISSADLDKPELKAKMVSLFSGVNRSSGSSDWLRTAFLQGNYDAMVNYESVVIQTNQQLVSQGKEPLYVVYPSGGLTIADYPFGYINNGNADKDAFFKKLQAHLLDSQTQAEILKSGRRTGFGGVVENADPNVFNPAWGIDVKSTLSPINYPAADVIMDALNRYQTAFKKPSTTVFAIDFSGSMSGNGGEKQVKQAMDILLNQEKAKQYLLQTSDDDKIIIVPFSDHTWPPYEAQGSENLSGMYKQLLALSAKGGTDIYTPIIDALAKYNGEDLQKRNVSVVLMTDGESNTGKTFKDLKNFYASYGRDIPVYAISFGDASLDQLNQIAKLTNGTVFNGSKDLVSAFRQARGYN